MRKRENTRQKESKMQKNDRKWYLQKSKMKYLCYIFEKIENVKNAQKIAKSKLCCRNIVVENFKVACG